MRVTDHNNEAKMPVETFGYLDSLNPANPVQSDGLGQGDDHLRGIKAALKATFPNIDGPVDASPEELNELTGGIFGLANGSAAEPSLYFKDAPTTGFYRDIDGAITFTGRLVGNGAVPTGAIVDFLSASIPTGWLELNGQAVSRTNHSRLFTLYGTTFGEGNGSTTFNLPNLNNRYRRSRGDATVGTLQADTVKAHTHTASTASNGAHTHTGTAASAGAHEHFIARSESTTLNTSGEMLTADKAMSSIGVIPAPDENNYVLLQRSAAFAAANVGRTSSAGAHTHDVTTGSAGAHTHTVTVNQTGDDETRPLTIVVVTCVKT